MGRRRKTRKRIQLRPPKKLPKIFTCPNCGATVVNVKQDKKAGKVKVVCGNCGLEATFDMVPGLLPVDYYNKFVDLYYQGQIKPKKEEILTLTELQAYAAEETTETTEVTGPAEEPIMTSVETGTAEITSENVEEVTVSEVESSENVESAAEEVESSETEEETESKKEK